MLFKKIFIALSICSICFAGGAFAQEDFEKRLNANNIKIKVSDQNLSNMHKASTLLISCVDFRLRDETEKLMSDALGLIDDYDEVALPGAALTLVSPDHPHWKQTVEDIIGLVEKLHNIKRVVLLDHRGCGAFKLVKGDDHTKSHGAETEMHRKVMNEAKKVINTKFPHLKVYSLLLGLDGAVEVIK
jgi:carbonic anhydrase